MWWEHPWIWSHSRTRRPGLGPAHLGSAMVPFRMMPVAPEDGQAGPDDLHAIPTLLLRNPVQGHFQEHEQVH